MAARSLPDTLRHWRCATSAAAMARTVSAVPHIGTVPICSPLAGLVTATVVALSASAQAPAMKACWRSRLGSLSWEIMLEVLKR
jgi:hypothetical protein